jgi:integrase
MPATFTSPPQHTLDPQSDQPDERSQPTKKRAGRSHVRKPSARAPWHDHEIPILLDSLQGGYRVRNQALLACNVVWGLRAHEMLDVRMGDILNFAPDGSWTFKEDFTMSGPRLKGGKPRQKPWVKPEKPAGHADDCPCNICNAHEPKRSAPEIRQLFILEEMHSYLTPWIQEVERRVGKLTSDLYLWLSRKRHTDANKVKHWRAISRQQFWCVVVQAAKIAEPIINDPTFSWKDCGTHSCRKTVACSYDDIEDAQHVLGHKSAATTAKYRLANPREQRRLQQQNGRRFLRRIAA